MLSARDFFLFFLFRILLHCQVRALEAQGLRDAIGFCSRGPVFTCVPGPRVALAKRRQGPKPLADPRDSAASTAGGLEGLETALKSQKHIEVTV